MAVKPKTMQTGISVKKILIIITAVVLLLATSLAVLIYLDLRKSMSDDPLVWHAEIDAFDEHAAQEPANAVLFVGSSSIRLWTSLKADMSPMPVIQRGFGGAKMVDVAYYAERLVNQYHPSAVVVFVGTNDLHPGREKPPEVLLSLYKVFVAKVRLELPDVPIYYVAITPTPKRWEAWPAVRATNNLIKAYIETEDNHVFIDTEQVFLEESGTPIADNYTDSLHLSEQGYAQWTGLIKPLLLANKIAADE